MTIMTMSTNRIFRNEDGQWYFHVRGNQAAGPYASQQDAGRALADHVRSCQRRTTLTVPWPREWTPSRLLRRGVSAPRHT